MLRTLKFVFVCLCCLPGLPTGWGQSLLAPVTDRRDVVFDPARQLLYITTTGGLVRQFDLLTRNLLTSSYNLGGSLNGADITADSNFLVVAQNASGINQGTFHKLDLTTGLVTNINYTKAFAEGGAWDVAIGVNDIALGTTRFNGSGWTPLRQIALTTNTITTRPDAPGSVGGGQVRNDTQIHRSADRTRLYILESDISSGPIFTYSGVTNTFGPAAQTNTFLDLASAAVSPNGSMLATRIGSSLSIDTAPDFNFLRSFSGLEGGVAFDPLRNVVYAVDFTDDKILGFDLATGGQIFSQTIGEDLQTFGGQFGTGQLVASPDGQYLALSTPSGVRLFNVPEPATTTWLAIAGMMTFLSVRRNRRLE